MDAEGTYREGAKIPVQSWSQTENRQVFDAAVSLWCIHKGDIQIPASAWGKWGMRFLCRGPVTCSILGAEVVKRQPCLHVSCVDKFGERHLQYIPLNHSALPKPVCEAARLLLLNQQAYWKRQSLSI